MVREITTEEFKELIYNFEENPDKWVYKGDKPAIVDYFADWCQPCKAIGPILEDLSEQYEGKLDIFKVNVDDNPELAQAFGIQSIPSLLFVPMNEQPQMAMGALPKESFNKVINETLKVE
jgi:thioredoxin 1